MQNELLPCQADLFALSPEHTYLNGAFMSAQLKSVTAAGIRAVCVKAKPYDISGNDFFEPLKEVQKLYSKLINSSEPERVVYIPSASYGIAIAAKNIALKPGQNIVVVGDQFPSNVYSWRRLAAENDAVIRTVEAPKSFENRAKNWNKTILEAIDSQTAVVAMGHIHWADGTLFDLLAIRKKSKQYGAYLIIDGTQSVGALPFDVEEIQPDALICATYKWLMGPYAAGLAWFGPRFDDGIPLEENWINRLHSENFAGLVNYTDDYQPGAARYHAGEQSNFIALPMIHAALEQLLEWQTPNIQNYCQHISQDAIEKLRKNGYWIETESGRSKHLFGIYLPENSDLQTLKDRLAHAQIHVSFRGNAVRVSPHLYNTAEDFDLLVETILGR